jgi:hypothetical protein
MVCSQTVDGKDSPQIQRERGGEREREREMQTSWINSQGQQQRSGSQAWPMGNEIYHHKESVCYKMLHRPFNFDAFD